MHAAQDAGTPGGAPPGVSRRREASLLLGLAFASFVALGLPDGLLGVAWPSIRATFDLDLDALGALFLATTAGYVASSLAAGPLVVRFGIGGLLALSCATAAFALIGYALAPAWAGMVLLGVVAGAGGGAIDAGLNTHAAVHYSARVVNLLHAFYGVGTTAGPMIMTAVLLADLRWQLGYLIVALVQVALAGSFAATRRRWPAPVPLEGGSKGTALRETLVEPRVLLSMLIFFVYVGIEAAAGVWSYSLLHEGRGISMATAGAAVTLYWGGLFAGRVGYALLPLRVTPEQVIVPCMTVALLAMGIVMLAPGAAVSIAALALVGIASGPIFPSLIASTPSRVGRSHTANAVGAEVGVSAIGGATVPALAGVLADAEGLEAVPLMLLVLWAVLIGAHALLVRAPRTRESG